MTDRADRPIAVGDLVQVVRPTRCCGWDGLMGHVSRVEALEFMDGWCSHCGRERKEPVLVATIDVGRGSADRLKRIPPLDELEGAYTQHAIDMIRKNKEPA